jgi:hypothetical protein
LAHIQFRQQQQRGQRKAKRAARSRGQKLLLLMVRARRGMESGALSFLIHAAKLGQSKSSFTPAAAPRSLSYIYLLS